VLFSVPLYQQQLFFKFLCSSQDTGQAAWIFTDRWTTAKGATDEHGGLAFNQLVKLFGNFSSGLGPRPLPGLSRTIDYPFCKKARAIAILSYSATPNPWRAGNHFPKIASEALTR